MTPEHLGKPQGTIVYQEASDITICSKSEHQGKGVMDA